MLLRIGAWAALRAADGTECRWARVLAFDLPDRMVFNWDVRPQWTIGTDCALTSGVEVRASRLS
jgi:hypothetical protein